MLFREFNILKIRKMAIYREFIIKGFIFILSLFLTFGAAHGNAENVDDYTRLFELIQLDDLHQPLYVFNDFEEEFDKDSHRATRQYFKEHPGLIERIKAKLEGGTLRWKLKNLKHRMLFVPESRAEYADLYKNYCLDVIEAI